MQRNLACVLWGHIYLITSSHPPLKVSWSCERCIIQITTSIPGLVKTGFNWHDEISIAAKIKLFFFFPGNASSRFLPPLTAPFSRWKVLLAWNNGKTGIWSARLTSSINTHHGCNYPPLTHGGFLLIVGKCAAAMVRWSFAALTDVPTARHFEGLQNLFLFLLFFFTFQLLTTLQQNRLSFNFFIYFFVIVVLVLVFFFLWKSFQLSFSNV